MRAKEPSSTLEPRERPRPPSLALIVLPFVAVIGILCTIHGASWISRTYPGFFLWRNNFVPAIGVIDSDAVRAGLPYHSRLIAVDGRSVDTRDDVDGIVQSAPPGTLFRYTFAKDDENYDITLASRPLSLPTFAWTIGNYLLNALILLVLGISIIFLDPKDSAARAFFVFCSNVGLYLATSADLVGPSWFQRLYFLLVNVGPASIFWLGAGFPSVAVRFPRLRRVVPALYGIGLVVGFASIVCFDHRFSWLLVLDRLTHLALVGSTLAILALCVLAYPATMHPAERARLRVFFLGFGGAAFIPAVVLLAVYTSGATVPFNYLTLGFAIFPAAIAYSIARQKLFGFDRIVRRTVGYAVVTFLIGLVYTALLALVDYVLFPDLSASPAFHVFVTMTLLVLFNPLRGRIQAVVDLIFLRTPYDYRRTVDAASRTLASILDLDELLPRLVRIITQQIQVEHAEVWLETVEGPGFRLEAKEAAFLGADSPLALYLRKAGTPLHVAQLAIGGGTTEDARRALAELGGCLAVPLILERRLIGFLALGEKGSGRLYTKDDVELLTTLANQAAVAVQNARAYRALQNANRELRETRDRLLEAERLAAIGELSAAVAHGIRNPVAGIKSAAEFAMRGTRSQEELKESFVDILSEADALESRISELLDFARPFAPNLAPADLNRIVEGSLHLMRRQVAARGIEVDVSLSPDLPPHELDEAQLEQVCLALMTNAVEAMPEGGRLTVSTTNDPSRNELRLRIADTGQGIPPEQLQRIFRLFYTRKARGTGVGLAVTKRIVEGHGGVIEVESESGKGTEFRLILPVRTPAASPATGNAPVLRSG
jgi:signal transduction histidine kinase